MGMTPGLSALPPFHIEVKLEYMIWAEKEQIFMRSYIYHPGTYTSVFTCVKLDNLSINFRGPSCEIILHMKPAQSVDPLQRNFMTN